MSAVRTASSIFLLVLFSFSLFNEIILGTQPTTRIFTYVDVTPQRCRRGNRSQFVPLTEVPDLWACLREYNAKVFFFAGAVHCLSVWPCGFSSKLAQLR